MNRSFVPRKGSLEKGVSDLFARVTFGATGAPTLDVPKSKGIASIVRNSAGLYTITLSGPFQRLLAMSATFVLSSGIPASPVYHVVADNSASATPTLQIQFEKLDTPAATDPANGEEVRMNFIFKDSIAA